MLGLHNMLHGPQMPAPRLQDSISQWHISGTRLSMPDNLYLKGLGETHTSNRKHVTYIQITRIDSYLTRRFPCNVTQNVLYSNYSSMYC